ncbi:MAG: VWA domain-containing protein [Bryobacteraceae bacterium]|jgi:VWFA-related protein
MRVFLLTVLCGLLAAQQTVRPYPPQEPAPVAAPQQKPQEPSQEPPKETAESPGLTIPVNVDVVIAPVLVFNHSGGYVNNITPEQFHLYDNGSEQNIKVDVQYTPISLVILIQASANVDALLPQVNKIGNLIGPQVIGDAGESAVIAFDHRIRVLQEFTSDPAKIGAAIKKITPGSTSSRMVDAVEEGTRLLASRPRGRRRVMLLIGETRDLGSEGRTRDAALGLQMANVAFYSVDMSRFINTLTAPPRVSRPDPLPATARPMPAGVPSTPSNVQAMYGINDRAEFIPLFVELFRDVKAVFVDNPVELFTKWTGGTEFGFHSQRTLESALSDLGGLLHSEYTVSYSPDNREASGFHEIRVEVVGHPEATKVATRLGYWLGAKP